MDKKPTRKELNKEIEEARVKAMYYHSMVRHVITGLAGHVRDAFVEGYMLAKYNAEAGGSFKEFEDSETFGRVREFIKSLSKDETAEKEEAPEVEDSTDTEPEEENDPVL